MGAKILDGEKLSHKRAEALRLKVRKLARKPKLAIIQIGDDAPSTTYIRRKRAMAERIGIPTLLQKYPSSISHKKVAGDIARLNRDKSVQGIMVQLPIPDKFSGTILDTITPEKDVDGLTRENIKRLFDNEEAYLPATTKGILTLLESEKVGLKGKRVVMVGQSALVGRPTALALLNRGATVTICHIETRHLERETRQADILIVAAGKPKLIKEKHVRKGQVVIDVGINIQGKHVVGDVDFPRVSKVVRVISPVPGGVGPMTIVSLLENLVLGH